MVPTVISADPSGPNRVSFPSMVPPGLSLLATWDTVAGSRWLPCASASIETTVWPRKRMAMTAAMAYPCRGLPTSRPNMRTVANGSTMTSSRSNMLVNPVGFSNGCAPPAP